MIWVENFALQRKIHEFWEKVFFLRKFFTLMAYHSIETRKSISDVVKEGCGPWNNR